MCSPQPAPTHCPAVHHPSAVLIQLFIINSYFQAVPFKNPCYGSAPQTTIGAQGGTSDAGVRREVQGEQGPVGHWPGSQCMQPGVVLLAACDERPCLPTKQSVWQVPKAINSMELLGSIDVLSNSTAHLVPSRSWETQDIWTHVTRCKNWRVVPHSLWEVINNGVKRDRLLYQLTLMLVFFFLLLFFCFIFFNSRWKLWLSFHLVRCITSSFNSDLTKTLLKLVKPKLTKPTSVCMLAQKLMLGRILLSSFLDGRCFDRWSHLFGSVCSVFLGKLVAIWGWFDSEWKAAWQSQLPRMTRE